MAGTRKKRPGKPLGGEEGLTIVEVVIVMVVTGILVVAVMPFFRLSVDSYVSIRKGKELQQMARIGFYRMIAEMKLIEDSLDIDYGNADNIRFDIPSQSDIDYAINGTVLQREGVRLIESVQSFLIQYYREDGTQKSPGFSWDSDVWRIQINIVVGDGTTNITLQGQISPRNILL